MQSFSKTFANSLRGIMQVGIICSHLHYALGGAFVLFLIANKIGTSIISMYFFISGFGLMTNLLRNRGEAKAWKGFFSKRVWGIFKVLLVITLLFLGLNYLDKAFIPSNILIHLVEQGVTPLPNSWFVFSLIYLYSSFYLAFRFLELEHYNWGFLFLFLLILGGMIICISLGYERAWWVTNLAFLSGALYARFEKQIFSFAYSFLGIALLSITVLALLLLNIEVLLSLTYLFIPIVAIVVLHRLGYVGWIEDGYQGQNKLLTSLDRAVKRGFSFLTSISYELYLVHGMMIVLLRGNHIYIHSDYFYILSVFFGAILLAYVLHQLLNFRLTKNNEG